jgi:hypothetical protein
MIQPNRARAAKTQKDVEVREKLRDIPRRLSSDGDSVGA